MATEPDDQAFPHATFTDSAMQGLTKREYFAIQGMNGIISSGNLVTFDPPAVAESAVKYADALIVELNKK